jgi:hypothetical protein
MQRESAQHYDARHPRHCTALHCTALHCTTLHCTAQCSITMLGTRGAPHNSSYSRPPRERGHSCTHTLIYSLICSLIHSLICSLIHSLIHPMALVCERAWVRSPRGRPVLTPCVAPPKPPAAPPKLIVAGRIRAAARPCPTHPMAAAHCTAVLCTLHCTGASSDHSPPPAG